MKGRRTPEPTVDHAANLRERLGRVVRDAWVAWAKEQPNPKPHHLDSWEALPESIREVDRRIGQAVMDAIVKRGKGHGQVHVGSLVSTANGKPYVELSLDVSPAQLTPGKAREVALLLLECSDAAESDSVLMAFARDSIGLDEVRSAQLLGQFRRYRERMRGKEADAA